MNNMTNLRERTAELSKRAYATHTGRPVDIACELDDLCDELAAVATDWQAAYDRQAEQIKTLTEAVMAASANLDKKDEQIKRLREAITKTTKTMKTVTPRGNHIRKFLDLWAADMDDALAATEPKE